MDALDEKPKHKGGNWVKGESGNPAGRRRGPNPKAVLESVMFATYSQKKSALLVFWEKQLDLALDGNPHAAKLIADRMNPVKLVLEGSDEGAPIVRLFVQGAAHATQGLEEAAAPAAGGTVIDAAAPQALPVVSVVPPKR